MEGLYLATRSSLREKAMFGLYQYLLLKSDIRVILEDLCKKELKDIDPFILENVIECLENMDEYKDIINKNLKDWSFERLGYIEQAILLLATNEITAGEVQKPIVINEAVELAKKYCDEDSYKFINGVLDRL